MHLIAAFTTTNIDDNVTVRELRQCLGDDGLATTESTRNGSSATLYTATYDRLSPGAKGLRIDDLREEGIKDTLTSEEGEIGGLLLGDGSRSTNRPELQHSVLGGLAVELGFQNDILAEQLVRRHITGDLGDRTLTA